MTRQRHHVKRGKGRPAVTRGGPVTIIHADGIFKTEAAYTKAEAEAIVRRGETVKTGGPPPWLIAKHSGTCPVCGWPIKTGDRTDLRGWEHRVAVHHHCTPHYRAGTG